VTNILNVDSPHWLACLRPEFRWLVPATSFLGPTDAPSTATSKMAASGLLKKLEVALWHESVLAL
jgi:hypothetical protein